MSCPTRKKHKPIQYQLQKGKCCYCEKLFDISHMTWEHIKRKQEGGLLTKDNRALACHKCNHHRGNIPWIFWKSIRLGEISVREYQDFYSSTV
jgi:5-methylcytosine-specific restriction endonuclease McrA